jgi:dihydrodipicolinate synthase/N-acetylneuraminate lyase
MTTAPPIAPAALLRPRRKIRGMSAILLPFRPDRSIDWDAFAAHIARTRAAGSSR